MGQKIVYCSTCQTQLRSADFEKGKAFHVEGPVYCKPCVRELLRSLPPEKLDPLLKRMEELHQGQKTPDPESPPGNRTERISRVLSGVYPTRRFFRTRSVPGSIAAVLVGVGLLGAAAIWVTTSGPEAPERRPAKITPTPRGFPGAGPADAPPPAASPAPSRDQPPPSSSPEQQEEKAKESLRKAREFASAEAGNLSEQHSHFEEAVWEARGTPLEPEARAELKAVEKRQMEALSLELSGLDEKARPLLEREEFSKAIRVLTEARDRHRDASWIGAIDQKLSRVNERAAQLFAPLKEKALDARKRGRDAELGAVREHVGRWGLSGFTDDLEKALADPARPTPVTPIPLTPPAKPPPAPSSLARAALPDPARQREAELNFRRLFNVDQAKTPKEKSELARTLLETARSSRATDADLYMILRQARTLAVQGGDLRAALEAIGALATTFEMDEMKEKLDLFAKATVKGQEAAAWATAALQLAAEASEKDDWETALKLATRAEALARTTNVRSLQKKAEDRAKEIANLRHVTDGLKPHWKTLESTPDDPAANAAVGKFLALVKGDWKLGLPMLAKGSDAVLKALAEKELENPSDAAAQAALGEAWAAQAEKETPGYRGPARLRAAVWLSRAIPGLVDPAKSSAERKLASLGPPPEPKDRLTMDLGNGVKLELVYIKPGTFIMGGKEAPETTWQTDERPEHPVTLTMGYCLGKYPVTRGQFAAFAKATGYRTEAERAGKAVGRTPDGKWQEIAGNNWLTPAGFTQTDDHPATSISWNDAHAFCDWATRKAGRTVTLPTEAEWEYACRAGTRTRWSWGEEPGVAGDYGWYSSNSGWATHPVGQKKPNPWGLYDMHGSVWEWTQDWSGPYSSREEVNPTGPRTGDNRIARGGCWYNEPGSARSSLRAPASPSNRSEHYGFRVCLHDD